MLEVVKVKDRRWPQEMSQAMCPTRHRTIKGVIIGLRFSPRIRGKTSLFHDRNYTKSFKLKV